MGLLWLFIFIFWFSRVALWLCQTASALSGWVEWQKQ